MLIPTKDNPMYRHVFKQVTDEAEKQAHVVYTTWPNKGYGLKKEDVIELVGNALGFEWDEIDVEQAEFFSLMASAWGHYSKVRKQLKAACGKQLAMFNPEGVSTNPLEVYFKPNLKKHASIRPYNKD